MLYLIAKVAVFIYAYFLNMIIKDLFLVHVVHQKYVDLDYAVGFYDHLKISRKF